MLDELAVKAAIMAVCNSPSVLYKRTRSSSDIQDDLAHNFAASSDAGNSIFKREIVADIIYSDFYSDQTHRVVTIKGMFQFNNVQYFNCFCHLRNEIRTFRVDRMESLVIEGIEISSERQANCTRPDLVGLTTSLSDLGITDFFTHPKSWGDYRRPMAVLMRAMEQCEVPFFERFYVLFDFASDSLRQGVWKDWYSDGRAAGLALQTYRINVSDLDWIVEYDCIKGGRFNKEALSTAVEHLRSKYAQ
jgi:hypothetical protein